MTGPEHYEHAENWLFKAQHQGARGGTETAESCAALAQVHATLALAAAIGLGMAVSEPADADVAAWYKVAGTRAEAQA